MTAARVVMILLAVVGLWQDTPKPAAPQPQPVVPLAASTLAANPEAYVGMKVSITAPVREPRGGTAFTIGQDPAGATNDVLVVAPRLTAPVQPRTYVTVIGEVGKVDGRIAVLATSVIDASMTDLAKRPPLPGEEALDKTMKQVGPAFNALRTPDSAKAAEAATNAATLTKAFADVEAFWKTNNRADAVEWVRQAQAESAAIDAAVRAGKWDDAKAAAGRLQSVCQNCHNVYRERLDDGTYRLKSFQ